MAYNIYPINVCVRVRDTGIQIEISKTFTDKKAVKDIIDSALRGATLVLCPQFYPDRIKAWNSLRERGIISVDPETNNVVYHL